MKYLILFLVCAMLFCLLFYLFWPIEVNYEFVAKAKRPASDLNSDIGWWVVIREHGFTPVESLTKDRSYTRLVDWDTVKNVFENKADIFVICYGCRLDSLKYSRFDHIIETSLENKQTVYNATANIVMDDIDSVYIYKVTDDIIIEHDIHSSNEYTNIKR